MLSYCELARPDVPRTAALGGTSDPNVDYDDIASGARHDVMVYDAGWDACELDGRRPDLSGPPDRTWRLDHGRPARLRQPAADALRLARWYPSCGLLAVRGQPGACTVTEVSRAGHSIWELFAAGLVLAAEPVGGPFGLGFRDGDWSRFRLDTVDTQP